MKPLSPKASLWLSHDGACADGRGESPPFCPLDESGQTRYFALTGLRSETQTDRPSHDIRGECPGIIRWGYRPSVPSCPCR